MNTRAIDYITEDFYESLSFQDGEQPDLETVLNLFYDDGLLINNTFSKPVVYTAGSFTAALEKNIEDGTILQFMQRELNSKTEMFGKIARRTSVYEYSYTDQMSDKMPNGINYINFVQVDDNWKITSMVWSDESENFRIPAELLGH